MPYDDFQFEERVEQNIQRKRRFLRWAAFAVNLTGFLLYGAFLIVDISEVLHRGSPFVGVNRSAPHVIWLPMIFWFLALCIHLASVLIESGRLSRHIAARARAEEEEIIEAILGRLVMAEKRKRDASRLDESSVRVTETGHHVAHLETEEHPRHAML